jgi:hypothetical protein
MADPLGDGEKPLPRNTDSLGWMVGSTVLPKKARLIEGAYTKLTAERCSSVQAPTLTAHVLA